MLSSSSERASKSQEYSGLITFHFVALKERGRKLGAENARHLHAIPKMVRKASISDNSHLA